MRKRVVGIRATLLHVDALDPAMAVEEAVELKGENT
jgi:hypothetical protein